MKRAPVSCIGHDICEEIYVLYLQKFPNPGTKEVEGISSGFRNLKSWLLFGGKDGQGSSQHTSHISLVCRKCVPRSGYQSKHMSSLDEKTGIALIIIT